MKLGMRYAMMLRVAFILTILLFCPTAKAQDPTCGLLNDPAIHVAPHYAQPSEAHYDGSQLSPPASIGGTYVDPVYGCTIKRLTNGPVEWNSPAIHEYSNMSAINSNDTLIEIGTNSGWAILDPSGNVIVPVGNVPYTTGRWDITQPNVVYYLSGSGLEKGTVNTSGCAPNCMITQTTLHAFSEYSSMSFGGGEGDLFSPDHILLYGVRASDSTQDIFVYTISTDTQGPVFNFPADTQFDNAEITGSNQMVVNWGHDQSPLGTCSSGPCFTGFELFGAACNGVGCSPANASYVRHLSDTHSHSVESRDTNGNDVVVAFDAYPRTPGCASQGDGGIVTIRVSDGTITCILAGTPWASTVHVGTSRFLTGTNWIVLSTEDSSDPIGNGTDSTSYPLNPNWYLPTTANNTPSAAGQWGHLSNDTYVMNLDGSKLYRVYQSRSRPGASDYWKASRACMSRDGRYIVFDSDYGIGQNTPVNDYVDVYIVNVGVVRPAPPTLLQVISVH